MLKASLFALLGSALLASSLPAQDNPIERGLRRARARAEAPPVLITASPTAPVAKPGELRAELQKDPVNKAPQLEGDGSPNKPFILPKGMEAIEFSDWQESTKDPTNLPRKLDTNAPLPFGSDRPAVEIDGVVITTAELNQLVQYYRSFRMGSDDVLLRDAVKALIPPSVMKARFEASLPAMTNRAAAAKQALVSGEDFAEVVRQHSDDEDAPTADGRYVFGREVAVQPFDRLAHTSSPGQLMGPFLTQYGYHLLQVVGYQQGTDPSEDQTEVRHVLIMYPFSQPQPRTEIKEAVQNCKIRILDPALVNIIPPEMRASVSGER